MVLRPHQRSSGKDHTYWSLLETVGTASGPRQRTPSSPPGENPSVRGGFLGRELWKRLELDRFFELTMGEEAAEVRWSRVAAVLAINRLCAPGSELAIEARWYPATALDDLLEIEEGKINGTRLYCCLDRMQPHKSKLEQHLRQRYGELYGAEFDVLL